MPDLRLPPARQEGYAISDVGHCGLKVCIAGHSVLSDGLGFLALFPLGVELSQPLLRLAEIA